MIRCECESISILRVGHDFDCIYMMCKRGHTLVDMPLEKLVYDDSLVCTSDWFDSIKESIERHGQLYPIKVKKLCDYYEVIDGKIRAQIAFEAGLKVIKAEIVL